MQFHIWSRKEYRAGARRPALSHFFGVGSVRCECEDYTVIVGRRQKLVPPKLRYARRHIPED